MIFRPHQGRSAAGETNAEHQSRFPADGIDNIGNIDFGSIQTDQFQHVVQKLAGLSHKGDALLVVNQTFSHQHSCRAAAGVKYHVLRVSKRAVAALSASCSAAREASIYTGITLAEYYRDMGYHCAIMADSTSRWAEALREISGRLEEMPAEEGFPAYLPSRLSQFYERAGYMKTLNGQEGSVSIIGAVSPQGADFSEPVTQNTKRFVRCFWALDKALAYARHYFAINWTQSYSDYVYDLEKWYDRNVGSDFVSDRQQLSFILAEESRLNEIVNLMGPDVLPEDQKLVMEIAKVVRVGYLQQNAFHKDDTYVPLAKQLKMMDVILYLNKKCQEAVAQGKVVRAISETGIFEQLIKMKYDIPNDHIEKLDTYYQDIDNALKSVA